MGLWIDALMESIDRIIKLVNCPHFCSMTSRQFRHLLMLTRVHDRLKKGGEAIVTINIMKFKRIEGRERKSFRGGLAFRQNSSKSFFYLARVMCCPGWTHVSCEGTSSTI